MTAPVEFTHAERALIPELGLAKKFVRDVRTASLTRGVDWQHVGNEVRYSEPGRAKLLAALHASPAAEYSAPKNSEIPEPTSPAAAAASAPKPAAPPVHALQRARADVVTTLDRRTDQLDAELMPRPAPSTVLVLAALQPGDVRELLVLRTYSRNRRIILAQHGGQDVRVRVKDSNKMRPGMTLRCAFLSADLWELAQRLPRWPGKP